jgi:hypothetical protein
MRIEKFRDATLEPDPSTISPNFRSMTARRIRAQPAGLQNLGHGFPAIQGLVYCALAGACDRDANGFEDSGLRPRSSKLFLQ